MADRHGVDFDLLDARGIEARWPQFRLAGTEQAMYQRRTGIVDAARANATHVALARGHGAEIREHSPVRALHPTRDGVEVVLDDEVVRAEHVVVTADARTNEVLDGLVEIPLTVLQEQVTYYATPNLLDFSPARFPVFMWHGADNFYGFPVLRRGRHEAGPAHGRATRSPPTPARSSRTRCARSARRRSSPSTCPASAAPSCTRRPASTRSRPTSTT